MAFVHFLKAADAQRALEQYNGVALDGKPMQLKIEDGGNVLSSGIRCVTSIFTHPVLLLATDKCTWHCGSCFACDTLFGLALNHFHQPDECAWAVF